MKKSKLRISIFGPVYPYTGGVSHYNTELCNNLLNQVGELQVISYSMAVFPWLYKTKIDYNSKRRLDCDAQFIFDILNPFTWKRTAKTIADFRPDVLIFNWYADPYALSIPFYSLFRMIKRRINCKIIAIGHDTLPHEKKLFDTFLTRLAFKSVNTVVVHSDQDKAIMKKIMPKIIVKKFFHPIYDMFYRKISQSSAKREIGVKGNVLLFFGYIRSYKGLQYLINALPYVLKETSVTLLVVGKFWEDKQKYLNQIRQLTLKEDVRIVGRYVSNEEVATYFSAADAIITPYISGSQSGVINIAYAFNKPVITTNVGGLGEIVHDGKTGYVVRPGNSRELADAIIKFYKEKKQKKFKNSIRQMKKNYSWEILCKRIVQELNHLN